MPNATIASRGDLVEAPSADRKIVHIDMDAFYASVEQRDDPSLRGKPVAVGEEAARGVVAAASYEAREFGVHSAMPSMRARRACPGLVFVKPRFDVYRAVSRQVQAIFAEYTPMIEPLSLDEAYLDVTENLKGIASATRLAEEVRGRIREKTGLTASAGVSYNKFLAKTASGANKPDGLYVIPPKDGPAFVASLPIGRFHGIGPATRARMEALGIHDGADLRRQSLEFLVERFGKLGAHYHALARGVDDRPVRADQARKSVGVETTFDVDLFDLGEAVRALEPLVARVWERCGKAEARGRTVTLKVRYADFETATRRRTAPAPLDTLTAVEAVVFELLEPLFPTPRGIRLLGAALSSFDADDGPRERQLWLSF